MKIILPEVGSKVYRVNKSCTKFLKYEVYSIHIKDNISVRLRYADEFGDLTITKIDYDEFNKKYFDKDTKLSYEKAIANGNTSFSILKAIDHSKNAKYKNFISVKRGVSDNA